MARLRLNNVNIADLMQILSDAAQYCKVVDLVVDSTEAKLIIEPCFEEEIISIKLTEENINKLI